jgi:predicted NACHT family NTPase
LTGAAVLASDGLDEILVTAQRREFVDLVVSFCNQYPLCPTLVTSRLVGYDDASLTDDFEELILERFDEREILSYLSKFFKVVGGRTEAEAGQFAQDFLRQTAANASDLRTNPLMLGLMAWLFNARGDVPSNRPEIYRECAILMFERWDPDRDIGADVPPILISFICLAH